MSIAKSGSADRGISGRLSIPKPACVLDSNHAPRKTRAALQLLWRVYRQAPSVTSHRKFTRMNEVLLKPWLPACVENLFEPVDNFCGSRNACQRLVVREIENRRRDRLLTNHYEAIVIGRDVGRQKSNAEQTGERKGHLASLATDLCNVRIGRVVRRSCFFRVAGALQCSRCSLPVNSARSRRNASLPVSKLLASDRHTCSVSFGVETRRALVSNLGLGRSRKRV